MTGITIDQHQAAAEIIHNARSNAHCSGCYSCEWEHSWAQTTGIREGDREWALDVARDVVTATLAARDDQLRALIATLREQAGERATQSIERIPAEGDSDFNKRMDGCARAGGEAFAYNSVATTLEAVISR